MEELLLSVLEGDVDGAIAIMRETAQWLVDAGMPLWRLEDLTKEKLLPGLEPRNFLIFMADGEPAAAMILQWRDTFYWPEIGENESGFVHKLCVRRKYAGKGLPRAMMDYAIGECGKRGVGWLRLDTDAGRPKLVGLYERLGFRHAGFTKKGPFDIALFEMEL